MHPVLITDPDDPRIAAYRDIRERDLVGREGRFVAEGEVVLRMLLGPHARFVPESVLLAEKRVVALADLLATMPTGVPVFAAAQPVLDRIAGLPLNRGILAIGLQGGPTDPDALLAATGPRAVVIVACGIANHDNLGGIFRNAAAFGADAVLLDSGCCDPLYRKAIRVSVGAVLVQPFARIAEGTDPGDLLDYHGFTAIGLSPRGGERLADVVPKGRMALLLGPEGPGLSSSLLSRVRTVRIPMAEMIDSLNVATASGIALAHLTSQAR